MKFRRAEKKILYSEGITEDKEHLPHKISQNRIALEKMPFKYGFNDYLKLMLAKIIPYKAVVMRPEDQIIIGTKEQCLKLQEKVVSQFSRKSYKKIRFKVKAEVDKIQFGLNEMHHAKLFRPGVIQLALNSLYAYDSFEQECRDLKREIVMKNIVLLRVDKKYEQQCLADINKILRNSREDYLQTKNILSSETLNLSQDQSQVCQSNYYELQQRQKQKKKQQRQNQQKQELIYQAMIENENSQINTTSLIESSLTLTQNDSECDKSLVHSNKSYIYQSNQP